MIQSKSSPPFSETFRNFIFSQKFSGILLLLVTAISLTLANSGFTNQYTSFWHSEIHLSSDIHFSVLHMINDGLMTIFFLLVGLEIKRELIDGELKGIKNASLPFAAAIGGMLVPALIYSFFNRGLLTAGGWGIPMATDIAFALGIISLLGNKVSDSGKILITALAVVDDLGAVIVIAIFYSASISLFYLTIAAAIFILLIFFNRMKYQSTWLFVIPGVFLWYCIFRSGIHSTISGVLLAATIPFYKNEKSLLIRMENKLHKLVNYFIMPLFALANTAILIDGDLISHLNADESIGIAAGLVLGKPIGIVLSVMLMVKTGISVLPKQLSFRQLTGLGFLGGIGFTMSIFISMLAFREDGMILNSKIAILIASLIAGLTGYFILFTSKNKNHAE